MIRHNFGARRQGDRTVPTVAAINVFTQIKQVRVWEVSRRAMREYLRVPRAGMEHNVLETFTTVARTFNEDVTEQFFSGVFI